MRRRPTRPCIICGRLSKNSRCAQHQNARGRDAHPAYKTPGWRRISRRTLKAHRIRHGNCCPGLPEIGHPPHQSNDLVVDHIRPLLQGGTNHPDNLRVICRTANTLRASKP